MFSKRILSSFLNSLLIFLAAYILAFFLYQISTALMANSFNIDSTISLRELKFNVDDDSTLWLPRNSVVTSVTLAGPIISLLVGLIILSFLRIRRSEFKPMLLLFLLWFAYHSIARFFAGFISGCLFHDEIWIGYTYFNLDNLFYFVFGGLSLTMLLLTGMIFFDIFLLTSGSATIRYRSGGTYLAATGVLPWFVGTGIITALHFPTIFKYEILILLIMGIIPISQNIGRWLFKTRGEGLKVHKGNEKIEWKWMIACTIIILFFALNISEKIS